jgi:hypothetical protein
MSLTNSFINEVKRKQQEVVDSMVAGRFVNFESYQRYVGIHQGLEQALDILNNLLEEKDRDVE